MTKEKFLGTWRLITTKLEDSEGIKAEFFGSGATGQIIYAEQGYMSAHCTIPNPPNQAAVIEIFLGKLTPEQVTMLSFLPPLKSFSYGGRYEILSDPDTVLHHGDFSSEPKYSGPLPRLFEFTDNNQLILSQYFPYILGKQVKMYLIWEKV